MEAREKAYRGMLAILQSGGSQVREILLEIRKWLPESGQEVKSESARRGTELLIDLLEVPIIRSRSRLTNLWPPGDALRSVLCEAATDAESSPILGWLFHTGFIQQAQGRLGRHINMIVWSWVLNTPVKRYLHANADRVGSNWVERLKNLPSRALPFTPTTPIAVAFHALILGDLATSLRGGMKVSGAEGSLGNPLRFVAETVIKLCTKEQHLLLESYWGEMMNLVLEVQAAIRPHGGIEDEIFRGTCTRLVEQYEGVAELKNIFGEAVDHPRHEEGEGE
jgi:hypothetical protein